MRLLILVFVSLTTVSVFAGLPEQDPVVNQIRNEFSNSKVPALEQLQLNKTWTCRDYNAYQDNYDVSAPSAFFIFSEFDGIIQNDGVAVVKSLVITPQGVVGIHAFSNDNLGKIFVRINERGDLIAEWTAKMDSFKQVAAAADSSRLAYSYVVCPVTLVK